MPRLRQKALTLDNRMQRPALTSLTAVCIGLKQKSCW